MSDIRNELGFEVVHFGINCDDGPKAKDTAETFARLFGFSVKEGKSSIYAGPRIEIMKGSGRGKCGHIAIATNDINKARTYLEGLGLQFDSSSQKYDKQGKLIVIYLKDDIGGFSIHLLQK